MATAYLLCGKTGSGKTSFARNLEIRGVVRFSLDEWMLRRYGAHMSRAEFDARSDLCFGEILEHACQLVEDDVSVVLDCGFWTRESRDRARSNLMESGASIRLIYFRVPDEELWKRLSARNRHLPSDSFEISREMFEMFSGWFQPPTDDELAETR